MTKPELKHNLDTLQEYLDNTCKWIAPEYDEPLFTVINNLLQQVFNENQYGWVDWWVWENNFGRKEYTGTQATETGVITVDSFDSLWETVEYLNKRL